MNIYGILKTKQHNTHYLIKYFNFISALNGKHVVGEKHHICPKAHDMFPEYGSFSDNPWNMVILTLREHYIAHWMLFKAFGKSQSKAFHLMCNRNNSRNSKAYQLAREYQLSEFKKLSKERIANGTHNFLTNNPGNRTGYKHSQESKQKTSKSMTGIVRSEDTKLKLKGQKRSIKFKQRLFVPVSIDNVTFNSCTEAAKHFNVSNTTITNWIKCGKATKV